MLKGTISADVTNDLVLNPPSGSGGPLPPPPPPNTPPVNQNPAADDNLTPQNYLPSPPPQGDETGAEKYVQKLIHLIDAGKVTPTRTDLQKFEIDSLQDHYFINLGEYEVEVSHSKHPESGQDFYVMLFNNIKQVEASCTNKVILAYSHLSAAQFTSFKASVERVTERQKREEENKRFQEVMTPVDQLLDNLDSKSTLDPSPQAVPVENAPTFNQS